MINFADTKQGDILRIAGNGAPGYADLGDLVHVVEVTDTSVIVRDAFGVRASFHDDCGAARLEGTCPQKQEVVE